MLEEGRAGGENKTLCKEITSISWGPGECSLFLGLAFMKDEMCDPCHRIVHLMEQQDLPESRSECIVPSSG